MSSDSDGPQDVLGVLLEVGVGVNLALDGHSAQPCVVARRLVLEAPAEQQDVGDDVGSCCASVCTCGEPDGAEEVGLGVDAFAGAAVGLVQGVAGGQDGDGATGADEVDGLKDEVVVDREVVRVVARVVEADLPEGDVADHGVEGAGGEGGLSERLGADGGVRVERPGDVGGDRVDLDAGDVGVAAQVLRDEADEVSRPGPGLEDLSPGEPQSLEGVPHLGGDRGVGEVSVDRRPGRGRVEGRGEDLAQVGAVLGVFGVPLVEDVGQRAPPGPPSDLLLHVGVDAPGGLGDLEPVQRSKVLRQPGAGSDGIPETSCAGL